MLGGLEVVDEGAGGVLPHERTTPKASTDRLDLTRATRTNLSPVWGLSLAEGLTEQLAEPGGLVGRVVDEGVEHLVERVSDPDRITAIADLVGSDDVLIADGHHRYGVSRTYRDEVRTATGRTDTEAEQTLAFVGELIADQLSVAAIHRLYTGISVDDLRAALSRRFDATEIPTPGPETLAEMEAKDFLVLITPDQAWRLDPLPGAFDDERALDGAWLESTLADVPHEVTYQHGLNEVTAAVNARPSHRRHPDPPRLGRRNPPHRPRRPPDAPQIHLLHPQTKNRPSPPPPLRPAEADLSEHNPPRRQIPIPAELSEVSCPMRQLTSDSRLRRPPRNNTPRTRRTRPGVPATDPP